MAMAPSVVDARGMRCPWPALRLARAMRDLPAEGAVQLLADDPGAAREIAALAAERGWTVASPAAGTFVIGVAPAPERIESGSA
jgi:tRNA 2-thiouridine synthesizing protein A